MKLSFCLLGLLSIPVFLNGICVCLFGGSKVFAFVLFKIYVCVCVFFFYPNLTRREAHRIK